MTKKELTEFKTAMKKIVMRAKKDKKFALSILHGTGMYTKKGNLKKQYR